MPVAFITGCSGQDGFYLTDLLLSRGYRVVGSDLAAPDNYRGDFQAVDISDPGSVTDLVRKVQPAEIYHLAAYHHSSDERPSNESGLLTSLTVNTLSLDFLLGAMVSYAPATRLFYAASSRVFGRPRVSPQNEVTPFEPICVYGISKVAGIQLCRVYREAKSIFASAGILYNHESPRRAPSFITRKLTQAAARASLGLDGSITVRNSAALVDWGAAEDYVRAMTDILSASEAGEFVVATGETHSVLEFATIAFQCVGLNVKDFLQDLSAGRCPLPPAIPVSGDSSRLRAQTGWAPRKPLEEIVAAMVQADVELLQRRTRAPEFGPRPGVHVD